MHHVGGVGQDSLAVPVVPARWRDGDHGQVVPAGLDGGFKAALRVLVRRQAEVGDLACGFGVLERLAHFLGADDAGVVRRHLVVGVDVLGAKLFQAAVHVAQPVRCRPFRHFRSDGLVGADIHRCLGNQQDLIAVALGERAQVALGVAVVVAVADVVDVHARLQGDVQQAIVRLPRERCATAVDQAAGAEVRAAERSVGHAGPSGVVSGLLGCSLRRIEVARLQQHLAANAEHGQDSQEAATVGFGCLAGHFVPLVDQ